MNEAQYALLDAACDDCLLMEATREYVEDGLISVYVALQLFARGYSIDDVEDLADLI